MQYMNYKGGTKNKEGDEGSNTNMGSDTDAGSSELVHPDNQILCDAIANADDMCHFDLPHDWIDILAAISHQKCDYCEKFGHSEEDCNKDACISEMFML